MPIREIPRHRWSRFVDAFNREHGGAVCTLEVDSSVAGPEIEAQSWPFQGLVLETGHGSAPRLQIFVGGKGERHLGHAVVDPHHIWVDEDAEGARTGLRVDADEGSLRLRFRTPLFPEYTETYLP